MRNIREDKSGELSFLESLPSISGFPYAGTPGQGRDDELQINQLLSNKQWCSLAPHTIAELRCDFNLIALRDRALMLPAVIHTIREYNDEDVRLEIAEFFEFQMCPSEFEDRAIEMSEEIRKAYDVAQRQELLALIESTFSNPLDPLCAWKPADLEFWRNVLT